MVSYERYAAIRDERGMTDYAVAKETGIPASTLSDWKRGVYIPKLDKIAKICKLFCITIEEIADI